MNNRKKTSYEEKLENINKQRKPNYRNSILRLIYLYRCFEKEELALILNVNTSTLNKETGLINELLDELLNRKNKRQNKKLYNNGKMESAEDYIPINRLWEIYDLEVKTNNMKNCSQEYGYLLYGVCNHMNEGYIEESMEEVYEQYVVPLLDPDKSLKRSIAGRTQNTDKSREDLIKEAVKESKEGQLFQTQMQNRITELSQLGVFSKLEGEVSALDHKLEEMIIGAEIDNNDFFDLLCYSMHFLHPSIYGYELLKYVRHIVEKNEDILVEPYIKYSGFQAQSILVNEKIIDIIDCMKRMKNLKFEYWGNEDSIIEFEKAEEKRRKLEKCVIPYKIIYDLRYGRYFMIGLDLDIYQNHPKDAMQRFQVDYMEKLSVDRQKKIDIKNVGDLMKELYDRYYDGTWMSRGTRNGRYRRITLRRCSHQNVCRYDYRSFIPCPYCEYNPQEDTYSIIVPNYLDLKPWIMEHSVSDGRGWFEVVREELVERDGNDWKLISNVSRQTQDSLIGNLRDTFETMESYYLIQMKEEEIV